MTPPHIVAGAKALYKIEQEIAGNKRVIPYGSISPESQMLFEMSAKAVIDAAAEVNAGVIDLIDKLRENEGAGVEFCCDNPDFNGLSNCCITVTDGWTRWEPLVFRADTILECLKAALAAREKRKP